MATPLGNGRPNSFGIGDTYFTNDEYTTRKVGYLSFKKGEQLRIVRPGGKDRIMLCRNDDSKIGNVFAKYLSKTPPVQSKPPEMEASCSSSSASKLKNMKKPLPQSESVQTNKIPLSTIYDASCKSELRAYKELAKLIETDKTPIEMEASSSSSSSSSAAPEKLDIYDFVCPISQEIFENPVRASDGRTYERAEITKWLETHDTSPMTNQPFQKPIELTPNNDLKQKIEKNRAWIEKAYEEM